MEFGIVARGREEWAFRRFMRTGQDRFKTRKCGLHGEAPRRALRSAPCRFMRLVRDPAGNSPERVNLIQLPSGRCYSLVAEAVARSGSAAPCVSTVSIHHHNAAPMIHNTL